MSPEAQRDKVQQTTKDLFDFVREHGGDSPDLLVLLQYIIYSCCMSLEADPARVMESLTKQVLLQHENTKNSKMN